MPEPKPQPEYPNPMKRYILVAATLCLQTDAFAQAQHQHHGGHMHQQPPAAAEPAHAGSHSPYAGMQQRAIKALSEQQVADLKAGRGMALALPAELNGYPGPSHTLELADALQLTPQQKSQTQKLFDEMKQQSVAAGAELLSAEESLDSLFKNKTVTVTNMGPAIKRAADAQAKLRETHLEYHLSMLEVLSAEQVARYNTLRGY